MALIKCPHCGQTVLSVASQCPKCYHELVKVVEMRVPAVHRARGILVAGSLAVAVFGMMVTAFVKGRPATSPTGALRTVGTVQTAPKTVSAPKAVRDTAATQVSLRVITGPLRVKPKTARSKSSIDSAIVNARVALASAVQPPAPERTPSDTKPVAQAAPITNAPVVSSAPASPDTSLKWTARWANVRGSPNSDSQVVRVLPPGEPVAVAQAGGGWFSVFQNGRQVGYVARQSLVDEPTIQN
jgi:hypothetical protein